jgi:hypothetical protein
MSEWIYNGRGLESNRSLRAYLGKNFLEYEVQMKYEYSTTTLNVVQSSTMTANNLKEQYQHLLYNYLPDMLRTTRPKHAIALRNICPCQSHREERINKLLRWRRATAASFSLDDTG